MRKKPSKRSRTKSSQKLKAAARKLAGGNVRQFEELYEESREKGVSRREQLDAPTPPRN
jgi:hypothetical protein